MGGRGGVSYMLGVMVWVILGHFDGFGRFGSKVMYLIIMSSIIHNITSSCHVM